MKFTTIQKKVRISDVQWSQDTTKNDPELDDLFLEVYRSNRWDPVLLFMRGRKGKKYYCLDGYHRMRLRLNLGYKTVDAFIVQGVKLEPKDLEGDWDRFDKDIVLPDGKNYVNRRRGLEALYEL